MRWNKTRDKRASGIDRKWKNEQRPGGPHVRSVKGTVLNKAARRRAGARASAEGRRRSGGGIRWRCCGRRWWRRGWPGWCRSIRGGCGSVRRARLGCWDFRLGWRRRWPRGLDAAARSLGRRRHRRRGRRWVVGRCRRRLDRRGLRHQLRTRVVEDLHGAEVSASTFR